MTKGLVYYSDCRGDPVILDAVRGQLRRVANGYPLVAATLAPGVPQFGSMQIVLPLTRSRLSMFRQILAGLEALTTDVAFLVEHDVLYPECHFAFNPPRDDRYYYNTHVWRVDAKTGQAVYYFMRNTSALCASRLLLIDHYRRRVERTERDGYDHATGYEPGAHRLPAGIDNVPLETWASAIPLVDIRHGCNLTASRWRQDQFRSPKSCQGWTLADAVPGWGRTKGRFREFLQDVGATA